MQIITEMDHIIAATPTAVAIGKFDGIHRGHQELLRHLAAQKEKGRQSVVVTFEPPPEVFFGLADRRELTTRAEKRVIFAQMGVDILVEFPMNRLAAAIPAETFVRDILVKKLRMGYICAGTDLTFGDKGRGDCHLLTALAATYGYEVQIIAKLNYHNREISSSYIREELEKGNLAAVTELLGHPYRLTGPVVTGNRLGRTWGIPTANLTVAAEKILPPYGVYYSNVTIGDEQYHGISNIGAKPTVDTRQMPGVETYLYDFQGNLYDVPIQVELLDFNRPEMKFADVGRLKAQLQKDILQGAEYFRLTV